MDAVRYEEPIYEVGYSFVCGTYQVDHLNAVSDIDLPLPVE